MTTHYRHLTSVVVAVVLVAGCTTAPSESAGGSTPAPAILPTPDSTGAAALTAYAEFWRVTSEALTAPRSRDWNADLSKVATGQALETVLGDVANYASLPAHTVGTVRRDPHVGQVAPARVAILDCVDLGDSRLVSDSTGTPLDDLANRTVRYRYRADVVQTNAGAWVVERTAPALDEPC